MNDSDKKALIKKLGAGSSKAFDSLYDDVNRKWFVGKIVDSLLSAKVPDASVEHKTTDTITAATKAMNNNIGGGFSASSSFKDVWKAYNKKKSRVQIIYGMIAMNPEFLDPANASYFSFILERRYRTIQRMAYYVNPNDTRNVFAYPDTSASPPEQMKVNKDAAPYWSGALNGTLPFILSSQGKSDPTTADDKLFNANKKSDRNLFACDPVATTLHMDALRTAKSADQLLKALAGAGDHYLKIDNPLGHFGNYTDGQRLVGVTAGNVSAGSNVTIAMGRVGLILGVIQDSLTATLLQTNGDIPFKGPRFMIVQGDVAEAFTIQSVNPVSRTIKVASISKIYTAGAKVYGIRNILPFYGSLPYHFVSDSRPDHALFEQVTIKVGDLQVGDHIYVINHPLYKIYYPTGAWGGEHSFISEIGNRDSASSAFKTSLLLEGHGLNDTLVGMGNSMLEWNNSVLSIIQALTKIYLNYLKVNGRKSTTNVNFIQRAEPTDSTPQTNVNVFEYNQPYTYTGFFDGKQKKHTNSAGFVIKELTASADQGFRLFNIDGLQSIVDKTHPPPDIFLAAIFLGSASADKFALSNWAVPFFNTQTAQLQTQPLFESDNKTPKLLTFDDLITSKPFFATDDSGDAYVTRPRVDFSAAYQTFLKNSGAI